MRETSCNQAVSWSSLLKIPSNYLCKDKCTLHVHSQPPEQTLFMRMVLHAGMVQSFQKAFKWRKFLVRRLLGKSEKTPAVCERTCECLHSLGLLLEDHSCRGAATPELQGCDSHLLAVGAYMTGMRQIDANTTIISWLQDHVQVQDCFQSGRPCLQ